MTPEQLWSKYGAEIMRRTNASSLADTQYNFQAPDGTIIKAGINPGQAATITLNDGPVYGTNTTQGAAIASQFPTDPKYASKEATLASLAGDGMWRTDAGITNIDTIMQGEAQRIYTPKPISVSGLMTPYNPTNFNTYTPTPSYNTQSLGGNTNPTGSPDLALTPKEQEAQKQTNDLQALLSSLAGESAYRTEQEKAAGLDALTKTQNDLVAQLNILKNEAAQIQPALQNDAEGKGITTQILGRQEEKLLNQNAIKSLSVASLLEASRNNLQTAVALVDRAVAQKYDPIREKIGILKANLELIINSPEYSLQDKNRAARQKAIQDANEAAVNAKADAFKTGQQMALDAIANNPGNAAILSAAQKAMALNPDSATYLSDVAKLVGQYVNKPDTSPSVIGSADSGYMQYDPATNTWKSIAGTGGGGGSAMGILDYQRYTEQFPQAGILPTDTKAQADAKAAASLDPVAKATQLITDAKGSGDSYETVISDIKANPTLFPDQTKALEIAKSLYGSTVTTSTAPRTLSGDASATGNYLVDTVGGGINNFISSIGSYLFGK